MNLYLGKVEDNNDPDKTGRVRVRIVSLHGDGSTGRYTGNNALDWFEPCMPFYGGYDSGSFVVPPVGAMVWCIVSDVSTGTPYRVYIGGCYGTGAVYEKQFAGQSVPLGELETPKEAQDNYPNVSVIFKSTSKSYILFDQDGNIILNNGSCQVKISSDTIDIKGGTININGDTVNIN